MMSEIEPTTLAYLAGIIDADGYITVQRSTHKGRLYFGAKVGISGTRREPHDLAASLFGGSVSCYVPKNGIHLPQFQWSRCGRAAVTVIEDVWPYLRIKLDQAEVALTLQSHMNDGRDTIDDPYPWLPSDFDPIAYAENLFLEAKRLNLRKPRVRKAALGEAA